MNFLHPLANTYPSRPASTIRAPYALMRASCAGTTGAVAGGTVRTIHPRVNSELSL